MSLRVVGLWLLVLIGSAAWADVPPAASAPMASGTALSEAEARLNARLDEQRKVVEALQERLRQLEQSNDDLRKQVAALEARPPVKAVVAKPHPKKRRHLARRTHRTHRGISFVSSSSVSSAHPPLQRPSVASNTAPLPFFVEAVNRWGSQTLISVRQGKRVFDARPGEEHHGWVFESVHGPRGQTVRMRNRWGEARELASPHEESS